MKKYIAPMRIELSKKGIPCIWEKGGAYTNTGECQLVCDMNGLSKKAIYVRTRGSLACEEHALIPIRVNDYIIKVSQWREDFSIKIFKIISIDNKNKLAELEQVNCFSENEWDCDLEEKFNTVIEVGKEKATEYHCRTPYFIKREEK